jgi:hypothetical protein
MTEKENPYGVKIGQIWVTNDPRDTYPHKVRVVKLIPGGYAEIMEIHTLRKSKAKLNRFHGRRGGYSKVER